MANWRVIIFDTCFERLAMKRVWKKIDLFTLQSNVRVHNRILGIFGYIDRRFYVFWMRNYIHLQYLDFDNLPDTNFSCEGKVIGGYYADIETGCQMFHVCTIGQKCKHCSSIFFYGICNCVSFVVNWLHMLVSHRRWSNNKLKL